MTVSHTNEYTLNFDLNPLTTALVMDNMQYPCGSRLPNFAEV